MNNLPNWFLTNFCLINRFDVCFGFDLHACCLGFLVQPSIFAVFLMLHSRNSLFSLFLNLHFFGCTLCWIDLDFNLSLIQVFSAFILRT